MMKGACTYHGVVNIYTYYLERIHTITVGSDDSRAVHDRSRAACMHAVRCVPVCGMHDAYVAKQAKVVRPGGNGAAACWCCPSVDVAAPGLMRERPPPVGNGMHATSASRRQLAARALSSVPRAKSAAGMGSGRCDHGWLVWTWYMIMMLIITRIASHA